MIYCMIPFIENYRKDKLSYGNRNQESCCLVGGAGIERKGTEDHFWG